ncbi:unnamed protein product [Paramecium sonneborni]|uniref:Uncharacterized protein n=1 Tax=Paramecium sonneborni TaxID=65129 RepID=A0A8S1N8I7_9CILI|nr:unnamed protein product [Paramecium sonneborni]
MGCVGQKQNQNQQRNKFQLHRQSLVILNSHRKLCLDQPLKPDPKQQIHLYRQIDISYDDEFILKRDQKIMSKNQESPNLTPKFKQNLHFGIESRSNKIII